MDDDMQEFMRDEDEGTPRKKGKEERGEDDDFKMEDDFKMDEDVSTMENTPEEDDEDI